MLILQSIGIALQKTNDWKRVKSLCEVPSVLGLLEEGDPLTKMAETYLAIREGNFESVENLNAETAQLCREYCTFWSLSSAELLP